MNESRWFLITDRKLKGMRLYGPFTTAIAADNLAAELLKRNRIRGYTVLVAEVPPRFENGVMHTTAVL